MKNLFRILIIIIVVVGIIVVARTLMQKPWQHHKAEALVPLPDSAISHFSKGIQIATISPEDTTHIDTLHFNAFRFFLEQSYPLIHQKLNRTIISNYSYVFEWKGTDTSLQPIILMGHYDVVPVEQSAMKLWTAKPFGGEVKNGAIWGRGSIDDKLSVISILEATENLLKQGYTPKRTVLLCFGHNEESTGTGAIAIVRYLQSKNIRAQMVVDEGGEISTNKIKGVQRPVAFIGVAEKGYLTVELTVEKKGGHSSIPDKETSVDILVRALYKLRLQHMPDTFTPSVEEFLSRTSGSSTDFLNKMALSNRWLFGSTVKKIMNESAEGAAMLHTTIVPTMLESGVRENVVPTNAKAIVNSRILTGETTKDVINFMKKVIDDERVKIKISGDFNTEPSAATPFTSDAFKRIENAVYKIEDDVIPVPFLMLGATDSRVYRAISDGVVNFTPVVDSKGYHGIDERLPIKDYQKAISFYTLILKEAQQ
ncbi:MAG: hypothetical protein C0459_03595 [Chitinophaga sp.]|jgi:carboxypeptidase PM20D1|nr:hypothetical protein [Chitinophaga sp.]